MKILFKYLMLLSFFASYPSFSDEESEKETQGIPKMNAQERQSLDIVTRNVEQHMLVDEIVLPAEITFNAYRTSQVNTRISAQVVSRHVRMGDIVKSGQKLVTLSSVDMADAQGQLLIANREWQRVQKLGRKVVSEQRYVEAQVNYQKSVAKLMAYGMTMIQIDSLLNQNDASQATGLFDLLSPQDGAVVYDQFLVGQIIEPGQKLMEISDDSVLWAEAQMNPDIQEIINLEDVVQVASGKHKGLVGKIIQVHRKVDETTRTLPVRIEISNEKGLLYPGQFVQIRMQSSTNQNVLAVPKDSVTLLHGEQMVFVLKGDELSPQLVETGETHNDWIEITAGLTVEDNIVTQGTFLLKSMLLKSQIGDSD